MARMRHAVWVGVIACLGLFGCPPDGGAGPFGLLHVQTSGLTSADVNGILYELECDDGTSMSEYVPVAPQGLPEEIDPALAGQPFADWFQLLPVTTCVVTATAMSDPGTAVEGCSVASQEVTIPQDETIEIVLVIECEADPTGALDVVVVVQDGISLVDASFDPAKFVVQCQAVTFTVTVAGGDGEYDYTWEVVDAPLGASYTASGDGDAFTFFSEFTGEFTVTVTITDGSGGSTQLTFPIHVGFGQTVEHCDETCCEFTDGSVGVLPIAMCEADGGTPVGLEVCEAEVCCLLDDGTYGFLAAMNCPVALQHPDETCEQVCCKGPDGVSLSWLDPIDCKAQGGVVTTSDACLEEVCCKTGEGSQLVAAVDCPPGQQQPLELCDSPVEAVCCLGSDGLPIMALSANHCLMIGGSVAPKEDCLPTTCCALLDGVYEVHPLTTCEALEGVPGNLELCERVCCEAPSGARKKLTAGACADLGHFPLPLGECPPDPEVAAWDAEYTLNPEVACEDSGYLVVPSSLNDQAAVYDLDTLLPIQGSPFATCDNPSRVMMDANTDVYSTCRGYTYAGVNVNTTSGLNGGQVVKNDREGNLLWNVAVPMCTGTRGVAMAGGRLFAACSHGVYGVYELDPIDGSVLGSIATPSPPYGIWATAEGLWIPMYYNGRVGYATHTPTLTFDFMIDAPDLAPYKPYGVAADAQGAGWFTLVEPAGANSSGDALLEVQTDATFALHTIPVLPNTRGGCGVQVGLDGIIYVAQCNIGPGAAGFVTFDPLTQQTTQTAVSNLPLAVPHDSHGLTVDAANNVYLLERSRDALHRFTPAGLETAFGETAAGATILDNPYGYSGDMTGLASSCISGTTDHWVGSAFDSGSASSVWTTITWNATTPPGTSVGVQISVDGSQLWTAVSNGQYLNVQGQFLAVKAILQSSVAGSAPTLHDVQVLYLP